MARFNVIMSSDFINNNECILAFHIDDDRLEGLSKKDRETVISGYAKRRVMDIMNWKVEERIDDGKN